MANQLFDFHLNRYRKPEVRMVDNLMSLAAFASPLLGVPQAVQVFANEDASGLSMFSWVAFAVVAVVFLIYALMHKIKPLIVAQSLWLIVYAAVIAGIILYG